MLISTAAVVAGLVAAAYVEGYVRALDAHGIVH